MTSSESSGSSKPFLMITPLTLPESRLLLQLKQNFQSSNYNRALSFFPRLCLRASLATKMKGAISFPLIFLFVLIFACLLSTTHSAPADPSTDFDEILEKMKATFGNVFDSEKGGEKRKEENIDDLRARLEKEMKLPVMPGKGEDMEQDMEAMRKYLEELKEKEKFASKNNRQDHEDALAQLEDFGKKLSELSNALKLQQNSQLNFPSMSGGFMRAQKNPLSMDKEKKEEL